MKKFNLLLSLLIISISSFGQFVTIPDANFVNWLQTNYPACMSGNQMDTTCPDITSATIVDVDYKNISDLEGIQYFDNLALLFAGGNNLTALPYLPQTSIINIQAWGNDFTTIPNLPPNLWKLNVSNSTNLTSLPPLPASLFGLSIGNCNSLPMPLLPAGLKELDMQNSGLTSWPTGLPDLTLLFISSNPNIGPIGYIPPTVESLALGSTGLTSLPSLPPSLKWLSCGGNSLSTIDIVHDSLTSLTCPGSQVDSVFNLPDSMEYLNFDGNNIVYLQELPVYLESMDFDNNSISSIPNWPIDCHTAWFDNNNLSYIPPLPQSMNIFRIENNNVSCLPTFPSTISSVGLQGNPFTCLPNYVNAMTVWSFLDTLPICDYNDPLTNPFGCHTAEGIEGFVQYDDNANCLNEVNEPGIKNVPVRLFDGAVQQEMTSTSNIGRYFLSAGPGSFDVEVDTANKPYMTNCQNPGADSTVTLNGTDSLLQDVNFNFVCKAGFDVGTQGISTDGWIFPGQPHTLNVSAGDLSNFYGLSCANGISGSVTINVTGPVQYTGNPVGSLSPNVAGLSFSYNISDFGSVNMHSDFQLEFLTDTTAQAGDVICVDVIVTPNSGDNVPSNNNYTWCYDVVNSYDPNNKLVYPQKVEPGFDGYIYYTINFQNTGTAPAFNIRLEDTLSSLLDYSTFEMIGYSHNQNHSLNNGILKVYFPNIMMEDSTTNEPESKGYFQYKIKPLAPMQVGMDIENTAYIFFDYNDPIITNTAVTYAELPDALEVNVFSNISVFPNPSSGKFFIQASEDDLIIELFDLLGKKLDFNANANNGIIEIDVLNAPAGIYLLKVSRGDVSATMRIVIK